MPPMKKVLTNLLLISFAMLIMIPSSFAESPSFSQKYAKKTCIVVIGESDVKTPDFFKYIDKQMNGDDMVKMDSGIETQSKYQNYWFDKGFLEEQKLTKQDLHDFVQYSGYDRVLFLMVGSPILEKTKVQTGLFAWAEQTRASIEVKAFLVDNTSIIKAVTVSKEDDSVTSELRAKRGAFEKCMKEVTAQLMQSGQKK